MMWIVILIFISQVTNGDKKIPQNSNCSWELQRMTIETKCEVDSKCLLANKRKECFSSKFCLKKGNLFITDLYRNKTKEDTLKSLREFYNQTEKRYSEMRRNNGGRNRRRRSPDGSLGVLFAIADDLMLKVNEIFALKIYEHAPVDERPKEKYLPLFEKIDAIMLALNEKFAKIKYKKEHEKFERSVDGQVDPDSCIPFERRFCRDLKKEKCEKICYEVSTPVCQPESKKVEEEQKLSD